MHGGISRSSGPFAGYIQTVLVTPEHQSKGLGTALVDGPLKWLLAYKMQLFLYVKASGATGIGTSNVWGGRDQA